MIVSVREVIDVVSTETPWSVIYLTVYSSLAMPRYVSFQSFRARVEHRYSVCVISPYVSECLFKTLVLKRLEDNGCRLLNLAQEVKLLLHNFARENTLDHIRPVETVHAVCAHHPRLVAFNKTGLFRNISSLTKTYMHFAHEMTPVFEFCVDHLH